MKGEKLFPQEMILIQLIVNFLQIFIIQLLKVIFPISKKKKITKVLTLTLLLVPQNQ